MKSPTTPAHDVETLAFYDREAAAYAARQQTRRNRRIDAFLARLAPNARILELGCGGGQDAKAMLDAGFEVEPTDGSPKLAAQAEQFLGRPVRVMRFDQLEAREIYDGVWAGACLLHVPDDALSGVLARIWRALASGGVFFASFKAGDGEGGRRDDLGRYNNLITRADLVSAYEEAGAWSDLTIEEIPGGGYDGVARTWLVCLAVKTGGEAP